MKQDEQKTDRKSISPRKPAGKTDVDVKSKQEDQKSHVKFSSPRKIAANRRNAQLSTGPRTERGMTHPGRDAIEHGDRKIDGKSVSPTPEESSSSQRHRAKEVVMRGRKTVTEKKIAANRQNAKRSTGPRTKRGKDTSRFNAVKAGLFAKHIVIPLCDGDGSERDFNRLLGDLRRAYQPKGPCEEFWVAQIAACMWKFLRVGLAESGSVRSTLLIEKPPRPEDYMSRRPQLLLRNALEEIKTKGTLSPEVLEQVRPDLEAMRLDTAPDNIEASIETCIARKKEEFYRVRDEMAEPMLRSFVAAHALPSESDMNLILRSESAARKKLDWALLRLLESQQRRKRQG
jgi:hypothetical protein